MVKKSVLANKFQILSPLICSITYFIFMPNACIPRMINSTVKVAQSREIKDV